MADQLRLVHLRSVAPGLERDEIGRRNTLVEDPLLQSVVLGEPIPIEIWPRVLVDEVRCFGHRLRAELRHEPDDARHASCKALEIARLPVVPPKVEMAIGPVERRKMGEHA